MLITSTGPYQPPYLVLQRFSPLANMRPRTAALALCMAMLGLIVALEMVISGGRAASAGSKSTAAGGACQFTLSHSIDVGPENNLLGVETLGANNTWAVGTYYQDEAELTLIQHWNGSTWDVVDSPNPGTTENILTSVAAVSANDIWAVGYYVPDGGSIFQTLIQHWNGAAWTVVPSPNPGVGDNFLQDVTAVSANDVWAVGYYYTASDKMALLQHWDGAVWTVVPSPTDDLSAESAYGGPVSHGLNGIEALSVNDIWAVGLYRDPGNVMQTLTLHWDGTAWAVVLSPNVSNSFNELNDVTMISANDVWAVGSYADDTGAGTLIEHWNGAAWTVVSSPNQANIDILHNVSAVATNDVWAVGVSLDAAYVSHALMEHWDGTAWSTIPIAGMDETGSTLLGVSTAGPGSVWSVGYAWDPGNFISQQRTLTERWDGTEWIREESPNPGVATNELISISALTAGDVWAVGNATSVYTGTEMTLIEHWDGATWSIVPSPNIGASANYLQDVAAIEPNDVWAVGYHGDPNGNQRILIEHWDGTEWTVVPGPDEGNFSSLAAVTAVSADDVWAVGNYGNAGSTEQTLVVHWDGTVWTTIYSPNQGSNTNFFTDVTAISSTDVWAAGSYYTTGGVQQTLTQHWDGSVWLIVPSPNVGSGINSLQGISAASASDVWAVGGYIDTGSIYRTLVEHWDGTAWTVTAGPNVGAGANVLVDVAALGPNDVWAVGLYQDSSYHSLAAHWNGTQWLIVPVPSAGADQHTLMAVSAVDEGDVWIAGNRGENGSVTQTHIAHYTCDPACNVQFSDVPEGSTFYTFVRCIACRGIINGYETGCDTGNPCFRPNNNVTRGQLAKIVANAAGFSEPVGAQQYEDVHPGSTFYDFVWRLANRGYVSGYPCGGSGEPCGVGNLPYFRPNGNAGRGQISKIVSNAAGYGEPAGAQMFEDVQPGSTFYDFVQRLAARTIVNGYPCGGAGEPCGASNLPYFRPNNNATRGQTSKIVANSFFPNCIP